MKIILLIAIVLLIFIGDKIITGIYKHLKNKKVMATTNKYVAKRNDDGTVSLFQVTDATGVDFTPTQILVPDSGETDMDTLNSELAAAQTTVDDLNARISAISALPAVVVSESPAGDAAQGTDAVATETANS